MRNVHFICVRLFKHGNDTQLMSFLRKVRNELTSIDEGSSLLLPVLVEGRELLILVERTNERSYRFVVVQTDPFTGLRHHAVSPIAGPPKIK